MGWMDDVKDFMFGTEGDAAKANQAQMDAALAALESLYGPLGMSFKKSTKLLRKTLPIIRTGFDRAAGELNEAGYAARQNALGTEKRQLGSMAQSMTSRGLQNTTVLDNANRGIYSDTSRRLAEIDTSLAGMLSQLHTQKAGALTGAFGALSQLPLQRYAALADIAKAKGGVYSSFQNVGQPGWIQMMGQAFAQGVGQSMSDSRLKTNIRTLGRHRSGVRLVSWDWSDVAAEFGLFGSSVGVIAQELAQVRPDAVAERDGYLMVDYARI